MIFDDIRLIISAVLYVAAIIIGASTSDVRTKQEFWWTLICSILWPMLVLLLILLLVWGAVSFLLGGLGTFCKWLWSGPKKIIKWYNELE